VSSRKIGGVNVYLTRFPPFFDDHPFGIYEKILEGKVQFPAHFDVNAKDIVKKLLAQDRTKRLGNLKVSSSTCLLESHYNLIGKR
jgi:hypothetical protein